MYLIWLKQICECLVLFSTFLLFNNLFTKSGACMDHSAIPDYYTCNIYVVFWCNLLRVFFWSIQCYTILLHCGIGCLDCHIFIEFSVTFKILGFFYCKTRLLSIVSKTFVTSSKVILYICWHITMLSRCIMLHIALVPGQRFNTLHDVYCYSYCQYLLFYLKKNETYPLLFVPMP